MAIHSLPTKFAPAGRASRQSVQRQSARIGNIPLIHTLFDAVPDAVLILNPQRQVVFANQASLTLIGAADPEAALGLRPGEALGCTHACQSEGGCGTTEFCSACGAVRAILAGLDGEEAVEECRLSLQDGSALDLQVYATPFLLGGQKFVFFVLKDISHEKRRRMLEHVFFHDILNSAGALRGLADVLRRAPLEDKDDIAGDVWSVCDRLIDEIKSQKVLAAAENNELHLERSLISTRQFLQELVHFYQEHNAAHGRQLCLDVETSAGTVVSDRSLLWRVLGNMVKNALEACQVGESVIVGCRRQSGLVEFWVYNPGCIPEEVRLQIFQRSFSTKGAGRGLGTYSIKLLGERYLGGKVDFSTSLEEGTVFRIVLPAS